MNKKILFTLLFSFIGDQFYILFVSVILLKLGYPSSFVAGSIALTVLPNLILGPRLGRFVDQSRKLNLHTSLCIFLAMLVNIIGVLAFSLNPSTFSMVSITIMMILYNCFFSPLNTLLYQYIIPSLHEDESKAYLIWERYQAAGIIISAAISYILLKFELYKVLLPLDGLSFIVCAIIIWIQLREKSLNQNPEVAKKDIQIKSKISTIDVMKSLLKTDFDYSVLYVSMLSTLAFIFAVDSQHYNNGVLFLKELKLDVTLVPLIMACLSIFNICGSYLYERKFHTTDTQRVHRNSLFGIGLSLLLVCVAIALNIKILVLFGLILLQLIEPVWSSTNTVLIRSQILPSKYGEFFGYFRIARSLVTSLSIFAYGQAQSINRLPVFISIGIIIVCGLAVIDLMKSKNGLRVF